MDRSLPRRLSDFSGALDFLRRLHVSVIGRGREKPPEDEWITVTVTVPVPQIGPRVVRIALSTQKAGFGRNWVASCPACGEPARLLVLAGAEPWLVCRRRECCDAIYLSRRYGSRLWYRSWVHTSRRGLTRGGAVQQPHGEPGPTGES